MDLAAKPMFATCPVRKVLPSQNEVRSENSRVREDKL